MRAILLSLLSLIVSHNLFSASPALLKDAVGSWIGERNNWAFTQWVREYKDDGRKQERIERYDPSRPSRERWELLSVDGRKPTQAEWESWAKRKLKKPKRKPKAFGEYLDFERASIAEETAKTVRYQVPLRSTAEWLFPVDKVELAITIDKATKAVEQVQAGISEPFKVALGVARVLDVDLDLHMQDDDKAQKERDPAKVSPDGTVRVVMSKFGNRAEYAWSDFKRVKPHPDQLAADTPAAPEPARETEHARR